MSDFTLVLFLISILGILVSLIALVVNKSRKKEIKKFIIALGVFLILGMVAIDLKPVPTTNVSTQNTTDTQDIDNSNKDISMDQTKEPSSNSEVSDNNSDVTATVDSTVDSNNKNTQADLTDSAIKFVTDSLKQDDLVEDAAIEKSDANSEITIAIQVNAAINNNKAKQLIESAARQLGFACGGKAPEKYYLGEIWEKYDGTIIIFSGNDNIMLKGYVAKGAIVIRYSDGTSLKLIK